MGRYGGFELSYGSDADVLFVHEPVDGRRRRRRRRRTPRRSPTSCAGCSRCPAPTRPLDVDADLRPEGKQGPLVRTLDSYAAYYAKWSKVWEAQALLRADAGRRRRATLRRALHRADRPAALPGRRALATTTSSRSAASRPASTTSGCPRGADPHAAPQARPRRAGRHRVDRPAAADAARRRGRRPAHPAHPGRAGGGRARPGCSPSDDADVLAAGVAHGQPGPQRGHPGARQGRRPAARATPASGPRSPRSSATRRAAPTRWSTTTCGPPASHAASSTGSSGKTTHPEEVTTGSLMCQTVPRTSRGRSPQRPRLVRFSLVLSSLVLAPRWSSGPGLRGS